MSFARSSFVAAAAVLAIGLAHAGDPVKVEKDELEQILPGKSIMYSNVAGSAAIVNFEKGGRVTYKAGGGKTSVGTWTIEDDGRYCIKITSGTIQDHCRRVWKTDAGYALGGGKGEMQQIKIE